MSDQEAPKERVSNDHFYDDEAVLYDGVGLKKARELLLYPSVTTVFKLKADAPQLRNWKEDQLLQRAYEIKPVPTDTAETWAKRVALVYGSEMSDAAAYGRVVHAAVEGILRDRLATDSDIPIDAADWIAEHLGHDGHPEYAVVEPKIGYGGTLDYIGPYYSDKTGRFHELALVDFKTQGVKGNSKNPRWREEWPWQLAAYAHAAERTIGKAACWVSVVLNTNEDHPDWTPDAPGKWVREWTKADIERGMGMMRRWCNLWYFYKKYPAPGSKERLDAAAKRAEDEFAAMLGSDEEKL